MAPGGGSRLKLGEGTLPPLAALSESFHSNPCAGEMLVDNQVNGGLAWRTPRLAGSSANRAHFILGLERSAVPASDRGGISGPERLSDWLEAAQPAEGPAPSGVGGGRVLGAGPGPGPAAEAQRKPFPTPARPASPERPHPRAPPPRPRRGFPASGAPCRGPGPLRGAACHSSPAPARRFVEADRTGQPPHTSAANSLRSLNPSPRAGARPAARPPCCSSPPGAVR